MRIIKHGKCDYIHTFTCDWCGCVFECTDLEIRSGSGPLYLSHVSYNCPTCGIVCDKLTGAKL